MVVCEDFAVSLNKMARNNSLEITKHPNSTAMKKKAMSKKFHKATPKAKEEVVVNETKETIKATKIVKSEISKKTKVVVPKSNEDVSCNWKKLCQELTPGKPAKRKASLPIEASEIRCSKTVYSGSVLLESKEKVEDVWFDDVDPLLLDATNGKMDKLDSR